MEIANYAIEQEIIRLHFFFENWFNATLANPDDEFEKFVNVLSPNFVIVSPSGSITPKPQLTESLYAMYGARPGIRITIHNPKIHSNDKGLIIATYEEWQVAELNETKRVSTVLFEFIEDRLIWRHVHETWIS